MYYCGVIHFLEEDYATAEEQLQAAYEMCLRTTPTTSTTANGPSSAGSINKNLQLILTYLIPVRLLTSHTLPTQALLAPYPRLAALFNPLVAAIRAGDLAAFNAAMEAGEDEFVKRRVYLTLERGRDIILRNVFRKVFLAGGFEGANKEGGANGTPTGAGASAGGGGGGGGGQVRRTRVPVMEFAAALRMAGAEVGDGEGGVDGDEVECLIANAIYKVCWLPSSSSRLVSTLPLLRFLRTNSSLKSMKWRLIDGWMFCFGLPFCCLPRQAPITFCHLHLHLCSRISKLGS